MEQAIAAFAPELRERHGILVGSMGDECARRIPAWVESVFAPVQRADLPEVFGVVLVRPGLAWSLDDLEALCREPGRASVVRPPVTA